MSANPINNNTLTALLENDGKHLYGEETDVVEFKSEFDWDDKEKRAKYCKSMAALCNNKGGYLVFGIENESKKILGVNNFDKIDPASISSHINNYFSPAIVFHKTSIEQAGKEIGVIYIEQHKDIPTIGTKTFANILKDGAIFYRYPGKSEMISGTDLIHLLHQLKGGSSKELVDLKKVEMKQDALPRLICTNAMASGFTFRLSVRNDGKRAKIKEIKVVKGKLNVYGFSLPMWLEPEVHFHITCSSPDGIPPMQTVYTLEIQYEDAIGTQYKVTGDGTGLKVQLSDPTEL